MFCFSLTIFPSSVHNLFRDVYRHTNQLDQIITVITNWEEILAAMLFSLCLISNLSSVISISYLGSCSFDFISNMFCIKIFLCFSRFLTNITFHSSFIFFRLPFFFYIIFMIVFNALSTNWAKLLVSLQIRGESLTAMIFSLRLVISNSFSALVMLYIGFYWFPHIKHIFHEYY
jgi:hypothetical protein